MSQPAPEVDDTPLAAEYVYLFIALGTGAVATATWILDTFTPANVPAGIYNLLCVVTTLAGCGYLVRSAETRVERRLDRRAHEIEEARKEGYAAGYLDCASGRATSNGHSATIHSLR